MKTSGSDTCEYKILWRDRERSKETKETIETVEMGDTCKYKIVWRDTERLKETKETVEMGDTCKYKIKRQREIKGDCRDCGDQWRYINFMHGERDQGD